MCILSNQHHQRKMFILLSDSRKEVVKTLYTVCSSNWNNINRIWNSILEKWMNSSFRSSTRQIIPIRNEKILNLLWVSRLFLLRPPQLLVFIYSISTQSKSDRLLSLFWFLYLLSSYVLVMGFVCLCKWFVTHALFLISVR